MVLPRPRPLFRSCNAFLAQWNAAVAAAPCLDKAGPACAFPALRRQAATQIPRDQNAPLPLPQLRRAPRGRHRPGGAAFRLVPPHPRPWRRAVHRPARPLRIDPGGGGPGFAGLQGRRDAALGMGGADRRQGAQAPGRHRESGPADRRGRGLYPRDRGARPRRRTADAGVRRAGLSGGDPAQVPLPRPAPRQAAPEHHDARAGDRFDPPAHEGERLLRIPDADPDRVVAGRRARLPGAVAAASRKVLRAAAGAAAVQAAHHGRGLRPLFPDRALLPRRGRARRPFARRVLSARSRDELRHPAGRVRRGRAGHARRVRGIRRRQAGDAEIPAHSVCGGDAQIRLRQAGPAQPDRDAERERSLPRLRLQDLRHHPRQRSEGGGVGDPGEGRRQPRVLRPHEFVGARRGPAGLRLHLLARGRRRAAPVPLAAQRSARSAPSRSRSSSASASAMRRSSSPAGRTSS